MRIAERFVNRGRWWPPVAASASLSALALAFQGILDPVIAQDSYQVLLGAVALSVMFGGAESGFMTLAACGIGKIYFLMHYGPALPAHIIALHILLFGAVGGLVCWIGGMFLVSQRRLSAVLSSMGDAVLATDESGKVQLMNPVAESLCGCDESEAIRRDIAEVIQLRREENGEGVENPASRSLRTNRPVAIPPHTVLEAANGRHVPVSGKSELIRGTAGRFGGVVVVLQDISESKQAEREREHLIAELQEALSKVKQLSGILPICASCKRIRDGKEGWYQLEAYITNHSEAMFSHGLCPECLRYYQEMQTDGTRHG
ncbi:MAG: PAS domain S-box protein [Bryobacteraceae bacterium]